MLLSYAIGIVAIVVVSLAWVGVQHAWGRTFPETASDPDVLARRLRCDGCLSGLTGPEEACRTDCPGKEELS